MLQSPDGVGGADGEVARLAHQPRDLRVAGALGHLLDLDQSVVLVHDELEVPQALFEPAQRLPERAGLEHVVDAGDDLGFVLGLQQGTADRSDRALDECGEPVGRLRERAVLVSARARARAGAVERHPGR
ncbi:MAG: hypothetical protein M5U28_23215 [Sandaracinaceae bacterium]|nr:hypothetical protein [Sandaracinaceae bacterium]